MKRLAAVIALLTVGILTPVAISAPVGAADDPYFKIVYQESPTFYPIVRGDDFADSTRLGFNTAAKTASIYWTVTDAGGNVIRTVEEEPGYGSYQLEWDGKTDAGSTASAGSYRIDVFVVRDAIGTHEGENLDFSLSRNVKIATDVITRRKRVTWVPGEPGSAHWDSKSASGRCRAVKLHRSALLDCWGRGRASAAYSFWLPTVGEEPGAGRVENLRVFFNGSMECCRPGRVIKKITHPYKHIWKGVVTVTNWRAYEIYSFNATYTYKKRR